MKPVIQLAKIIAIVLITSMTASASDGIPAKYALDNQFKKVPSISKYHFMDWDKVDRQSFVLQTSPNDYYLIILSSPSNTILFSETISIIAPDALLQPGYNNVIVYGSDSEEKYIINKIYRLKDADEVKKIKAQLTGETK